MPYRSKAKRVLMVLALWLLSGAIVMGEKGDAPQSKDRGTRQPYIIGCGDLLEINTWKEADFSRSQVLVRTDGKITFPLLDDIQAEGRSTMALKQDIQKRLKAYVANPLVTVHLTSPSSRKFYILGEVARTGEYPILKNLTVLQAFALAGGFTEWASKKEILLIRSENGKNRLIRINYKAITKGGDTKQNIQIETDDTIIVP